MTQVNLERLFHESLPFWEDLTDDEKADLLISARIEEYKPYSIVNQGTDGNIPGLQIIYRGMARVYISSSEGRQLTLQRISDSQLFALGLSCALDHAILNVILETETECEIVTVPSETFKRLYARNASVKHTVSLMISERFSYTMKLMEKVFFSSVGSRLAGALIEHSSIAKSPVFKTTHAMIASDVGTAREVVTRLLDKFKAEGLVSLRRGSIEIKNEEALLAISRAE